MNEQLVAAVGRQIITCLRDIKKEAGNSDSTVALPLSQLVASSGNTARSMGPIPVHILVIDWS